MANNKIKISVNGFFTEEVPKLRGFKQGDPISCICYDLSLEPFLLSILQDDDYKGYQLGTLINASDTTINQESTP